MLLVAWLVEAVVDEEDGAIIAPVPEASPHRLIQGPVAKARDLRADVD